MKSLSVRISDIEKQHLDEYCRLTERPQSDVLRQYIRSLSVSGVLNPNAYGTLRERQTRNSSRRSP